MIKKIFLFVLICVSLLLMLALGGANQAVTRVDYLFGTVTAPLSVVVGLSFLCGFIFAGLISTVTVMCLRVRVHTLKKQLARLQTHQDT